MKKIIGIIITLIMLTGCSNTNTQPINTTSSNTSSSDKQTQTQSENNSQSINSDSSNADSNLIDNINTTNSPFEKGYYDYQGTISNDMPIHMSIYPLEKDMVGSYFYDSQRKEIKLKGKAGAKDIVLHEYDEAGKETGVFKGTMDTVDKIEGTWLSEDGKRSYPFSLSLKSAIPGSEFRKRYALVAGTISDQDVESFVNKIQSCIKSDNKEQLAMEIAYPINVKINGKVTKIENKEEFIKNYNQIFYSNFKQAMSNAFSKYLFVNYQGIMFEGNLYNIWINVRNSKLIIIAINN